MTSSLRALAEKLAAKKKPDPHGWDDSWQPDAGWHDKENPTGWKRPKRPQQRKELFLYDKWQKGGHKPEDAAPLVKSLEPLVWRYGVGPYANRVPIQTPVLKGEALRLTLSGLRRYNPSVAQVNTFTRFQLRSMDRFVKQRQNMARITEDRSRLIGPYDRAEARLRDKLGREPTINEIADEMHVAPHILEKLNLERKRDLLASGAEEDPFLDEAPASRRALRMVRHHLTPDEEKVLDYLMGTNGKPKVRQFKEISDREGWTPSKVTNLKNSINKKVNRYL